MRTFTEAELREVLGIEPADERNEYEINPVPIVIAVNLALWAAVWLAFQVIA